MDELKAQYVIRRAIDEKLPDLHIYRGLPINQEILDVIEHKQNEFWSLVDQYMITSSDERQEILDNIFDDEALRLIAIYHIDQGDI